MSAATIAFLQKEWKRHLLPVECGRKMFEHLPSSPSIAWFVYNPYMPATNPDAHYVSAGTACDRAVRDNFSKLRF